MASGERNAVNESYHETGLSIISINRHPEIRGKKEKRLSSIAASEDLTTKHTCDILYNNGEVIEATQGTRIAPPSLTLEAGEAGLWKL